MPKEIKIKNLPEAIRDPGSRGVVFTDQHKYLKRVQQKKLQKVSNEKDLRINKLEREVSILNSKIDQILEKLG